MNYTRAVSVSRFILVILCIALVLSIAVCGVDSWGLGGIFESGTIRLGLDLSGGSIITYSADTEDTGETLAKGMDGILESMRTRLDAQGLTEANVYLVGDNMITLEIPSITDPNEAVETFGAAAVLTFRDADGNVFLEGKDVVEAEAGYYSSDSGVAQWVVSLELTDEGAEKFAAATKQAAINQTSIYTYMDDEVISTATVSSEYASEGITGGKAQISGSFDRESASALAGQHQRGRLTVQPEAGGAARRRTDAGRKIAGNQPEGGRRRSAARRAVYDPLLPRAGRDGFHCAVRLHGAVYAGPVGHAGQPHAAGHRRYHPVHRYGRRCERHHL